MKAYLAKFKDREYAQDFFVGVVSDLGFIVAALFIGYLIKRTMV